MIAIVRSMDRKMLMDKRLLWDTPSIVIVAGLVSAAASSCDAVPMLDRTTPSREEAAGIGRSQF